jgi:hypothetical protein
MKTDQIIFFPDLNMGWCVAPQSLPSPLATETTASNYGAVLEKMEYALDAAGHINKLLRDILDSLQ